MTMGSILRRSALRSPGKTAIVYGDRRISYRDFNMRVNQLSDSFLKMGLAKGDRIAILFHNCPEFFEVYFACAKTGGIFSPINNLLTPKEVKEILFYLEPRFLFLDPDFLPAIMAMREELTFLEGIVLLGEDSAEAVTGYEALIRQGGQQEPENQPNDEDIMSIFLTSGTTGRPKGAMRTHRHDYINALAGAIELRLEPQDRVIMVFPFYHVTFEDHIRNVLMSNTIVIRKEGSFQPSNVLEILSREKITVCQLVPTMIAALLQEQNIDQYDLSHLRLILYAAAPMPVELLKRAMKRFKCAFMQMYGQTETGPITLALKPEDHLLEGSQAQIDRLAAAGRPVLDYEARILDKKGRELGPGEVGEIVVRGEAMTVGYWNLPTETAETIRDGWLYTGDYGKMDEDGYIYVVDRKNDMIISGGKNIYPREIEEVLYRYPAVSEAAVIGVPDEYWGESVKALVVLKSGEGATEEEVIRFCKENMASYKKPRSVEFREELPKSSTGKILKRVIREEYWKDKDHRV
ncbi:MAG: long-chain-fatty-acid--CoA ligase [Deltaproteobacteria bacterium]|nr:long-chain-fatty-acid--CoA ligase [Deltaproteobacteria bacterium]